jgi:ABC-type bacteriocin/lantibiotic exporter with double-glycine peptidase domain
MPASSRIISSLQKLKIFLPSFNILTEEYFKTLNIRESNLIDNRLLDFSKIQLVNISYKYNDSDVDFVLENVNIDIFKNQVIGICGESGSGKTTLTDLILGLLKPTNGKILFNNININQHIESWNKFIGQVSQSIFLFNDTIKNNIILNDLNFNKKKFLEIIKYLGMNNFFKNLPNGYNSFVGDVGKNISGGQKQKIAIARMLYKNPGLIFLDEATNSLDKQTEKDFLDVVYLLKSRKVIIIISHDESLLKNCDSIYKIFDSGLFKVANV